MKILVYSDKLENYSELCAGVKFLGGETVAFAVCSAAEAGTVPAAKVFYSPDTHRMQEDCFATLKNLVDAEKPEAVFISATKRGKYMAARLAAALGTSALTDLGDIKTEGGIFQGTQMYYGGAAVRTLKNTKKAVITISAGSFEPVGGAAGTVQEVAFVDGNRKIIRKETRRKTGQTVNLAAAKRVVGVGRGFTEQADLALAEEFAAAIGAEIGCSRPIAEGEGWMDASRYIGVSGVTIKPDVYVAVGISGQVQHTVGLSSAKLILAINKDKNAPIFKHCDYGLVGDLKQALPVLSRLTKG